MCMVNFDMVVARLDEVRSVSKSVLGRDEIEYVSVEPPTDPFDELFFRKSISWLFVLLRETGPFFKFSEKLLRTKPDRYERWRSLKDTVECARTVHEHNMRHCNPGDQKKVRVYQIWIDSFGGSPLNWEECCRALLKQAIAALGDIVCEWRERSADDGDRVNLRENYEQDKRSHWDAHEFDPFVMSAAIEFRLDGFDSAAFRKDSGRIERWRKLAALFESREAAEAAIARAIRAEFRAVFGDPV